MEFLTHGILANGILTNGISDRWNSDKWNSDKWSDPPSRLTSLEHMCDSCFVNLNSSDKDCASAEYPWLIRNTRNVLWTKRNATQDLKLPRNVKPPSNMRERGMQSQTCVNAFLCGNHDSQGAPNSCAVIASTALSHAPSSYRTHSENQSEDDPDSSCSADRRLAMRCRAPTQPE